MLATCGKDTPAPGAYEPEPKSVSFLEQLMVPTSAFASEIARLWQGVMQTSEAVGPGTYSPEEGRNREAVRSCAVLGEAYPFNSTQVRGTATLNDPKSDARVKWEAANWANGRSGKRLFERTPGERGVKRV